MVKSQITEGQLEKKTKDNKGSKSFGLLPYAIAVAITGLIKICAGEACDMPSTGRHRPYQNSYNPTAWN